MTLKNSGACFKGIILQNVGVHPPGGFSQRRGLAKTNLREDQPQRN